jgi:outer membrane protein OmpA-like peptidoglycan-associated protein
VEANVSFSAGLRQGARARWGTGMECVPASLTERYVGAVFVKGEFIVQRAGVCRAVVHRLADLEFTTSERLQMRAGSRRLNDLTLEIHYVGGRGVAHLRASESMARRYMVPPGQVRAYESRQGDVMQRSSRIALAVAASLAVVSCASHKLVTPDGSARVAVNTPDSIKSYQDLVARQEAMTLEKSELERQVDVLNEEVARLKAYVLQQQQLSPKPSGARGARLPRSETRSRPAPTSSLAEVAPRPGTVSVENDRVVFRISHDKGHTDFHPDALLQSELLKAATAAKAILIRGRTDADSVDDIETRVALARACSARQYLVSNGVDPGKIRMWYRAAGGFVTDNSTEEGRALNRRVEIEMRGLDTRAFVPVSSTVRVGSNP